MNRRHTRTEWTVYGGDASQLFALTFLYYHLFVWKNRCRILQVCRSSVNAWRQGAVHLCSCRSTRSGRSRTRSTRRVSFHQTKKSLMVLRRPTYIPSGVQNSRHPCFWTRELWLTFYFECRVWSLVYPALHRQKVDAVHAWICFLSLFVWCLNSILSLRVFNDILTLILN